MTERDAYIALNMIDKLGPVRVRSLIARLGSPQAVFEASEKDLRSADGIGADLAAAIAAQRGSVDPAEEQRRAARIGARIVTPLDADYPPRLREIHDPPLALYVQGALTEADRQAMAVVGTRRCTQYGRGVADRLSFQLAKVGFSVISGLARGIDWAAHEGALKAGGRTIAVLGSALDKLYPPEAAPLAERIAKQGAVISEYTLGRAPDRTTFPYRNRVVSGMSMGVLVVEADRRSGAMITADVAAEQGRTVFAVPGRIDAATSHGTHQLLRNGARLVEDVKDVVEEFEFLIPPSAAEKPAEAPPAPVFRFSEAETALVQALAEGPLDVDTLARRTGQPVAQLGAMLIGLEMKRAVHMLPGRMVELAFGAGGGRTADQDD